jgi:hypothetical protein
MHSRAWRGEGLERTTKAISTAANSLSHRLNEMVGMLDQRTLTSMKAIRIISQAFALIARDQLIPFLESTQRAAHMSKIIKTRSNGLDSGVAPDDGNQ